MPSSKKLKPFKPLKQRPSSQTFTLPDWASDEPEEDLRNSCLEVYKEAGKILKYLYLGGNKEKGRGSHQLVGHMKAGKAVHMHLNHESISRRHAVFLHTDRGLHLVDLHSANGTYLNDKKIEAGVPEKLFDYDVVSFGGSTRKYKVKGIGTRRPKPEPEEEKAKEEEKESKSKESSGLKRQNATGETKEKVRCGHLLIKHKDVRRPHTWKDGGSEVTRSKDEAREMAELLRKKLLEAADLSQTFAQMCREESDCASHESGGDLGWIKKGKCKFGPEFEEAALSLPAGEISEVVTSEAGVHIIYHYGETSSSGGQKKQDKHKEKDENEGGQKKQDKHKEKDENEEASRPQKKQKREDSKETEELTTVGCRHLLLKHRDSRRPSSWKQETITRTKERAMEKIEEFRKRLEKKEISFADLAKKESDCGSYRKGGDLGVFKKGQMQKAFEEAAFALDVGQLSKPVSSDSGIHLILRYK